MKLASDFVTKMVAQMLKWLSDRALVKRFVASWPKGASSKFSVPSKADVFEIEKTATTPFTFV